jgi:protein TonB
VGLDMNAAIPASQLSDERLKPLQDALPGQRAAAAPSVRRPIGGVALACGLHAIVLALLAHGISSQAPVTPPQPTIAVSLLPMRPTQPEQRPEPPKPQPKLEKAAKPTPQKTEQPVQKQEPKLLTSAPTPSNTAESSASAAPATPAAPAAQAAPAREAPPAVVPPKFDAAYLSNPAPAYPGMSKRLGEQGKVLLRVKVGADGQAQDVSVLQSSGFPRLDEAAREAVRNWRFVPARQGDQAVAAPVNVPIVFKLNAD